MNRKQKIIVSVTGIFIVLLILVGLTYAYFLTNIRGNTNTKSVEVTTANLRLIYGDGNGTITGTNIMPGTTIDTKTFTVTNDGNTTTRYAVYLEDVVNAFTNTDDVKITMTCIDNNSESCNGIESSFPTYNDLILFNKIGVGITQTYSVTVEYLETGIDQSADMNKTISGKFQIYNMHDVVDLTGTITGASAGDYVELHSETKRSEIVNNEYRIVGVNPGVHTLYVKDREGNTLGSKTITVNKTSDESVEGTTFNVTNTTRFINLDIETIQTDLAVNSSIRYGVLKTEALSDFNSIGTERAGITKIEFTNNLDYENGDTLSDSTKYKIITDEESPYPVYAWKKSGTLYVGVEKGVIYAAENSSRLFAYFSSLSEIDFNNIFDTSIVTDMGNMFECTYITTLDLSSLDTSNVTSMVHMFLDSNITTLDLSSLDTSNVTNMSGMFASSNIENLDLSSFDTSNVTDMGHMFSYNFGLTNLDLSSFDTSNVTNMRSMFEFSRITNLDLSSFDTSNVTDMYVMFASSNIENLDLSNFDTSKVTDMSSMFEYTKITNLDLSSFDTSNVTDMSYMFRYCSNLVKVEVKNETELNRFRTMSGIETPNIIEIKSS